MGVNEFRWGVKSPIPGHWHTAKLAHDGFEVEIAADWIEVRIKDNGQLDAQRKSAEEIVEGIVRKMGLGERVRFMATFKSISQFNPQSNCRDSDDPLKSPPGMTPHLPIALSRLL